MFLRSFCWSIALLLPVTLCCVDVSAQTFKAKALPAGSKLIINGQLDEPAWQQAPSSSPLVWLGVKKKSTLPAATTFKVLKDADNIYLGIRCQEPMMAKLSDALLGRDGPIWESDCVEIFISPDGMPSNYYQWIISASNSLADFYFIESGNTQIGEYNAVIESSIFKGADYWTAEVRIPLSSFFHTNSKDFSDTWLLNVARERHPVGELTTWSPLRASFHESTKFNRIGDMPRKRPDFDLLVESIRVKITGTKGAGWVGRIEIPTVATSATAGTYQATILANDKQIISNRPVQVTQGKGVVVLDNVDFPSLNKAMYHVRFTSTTGLVVADAAYTVRSEYEPLAIELSSPFYCNTIFPGQKIEKISGQVRLTLAADILQKAALKITLPLPGTKAASVRVRPVGNKADFSIQVASLQVGKHPLTVDVVLNGKTVASKTVVVQKLGQPKGSSVYIDEHRRLVVNGKPVYVRGWYSSEKYLVSEALLQQFGNKPDSAFVNAWHCQVGMEAERLDTSERSSGRVKQDIKPSAKVFDAMLKKIKANRNSKTLWWYYLADEPECRGVSPVYLKYQYDFIKKHDPYHPVMIITRDPATFTGCADILNPHPYLSPTVNAHGVRRMKSPKEIRTQIRTVLAAAKGKIPAWLTPQSFSYGFNDPQAVFPTFMEYRCMIWTAVANGATGFTPFMYSSHFSDYDMRIGNDFIYESLAQVEPFLLSTAKQLAVKVTAPEDGVDVWAKKVDGKFFIIAVNLLNKKIAADITVSGIDDITQLVGFRENTTAAVSGGKLHLTFAPYQVHLMSNQKLGNHLKTVDTVQKKINTVNAAKHKHGNILYNRGREVEWSSSDTYMNQTLYTLTDGICDTFGWANWRNKKLPAYVEMQFPTFIPKFRNVKIYSATIADMDLFIWKGGDWKKVGQIKDNTSPVISFNLPKVVKTVKLKVVITQVQKPGQKAELYEIEMYK